MKLVIKNQDILNLDMEEYYIAHCISGDFTLGAGLAKKINDKYDMSTLLKDNYVFESGKYCSYLIDRIFNLVTKDTYKDKASYDALKMALNDMKLTVYYMGVTKLAIPKLGCGKDKLDWNVVQEIIKETFQDFDILIEVCVL